MTKGMGNDGSMPRLDQPRQVGFSDVFRVLGGVPGVSPSNRTSNRTLPFSHHSDGFDADGNFESEQIPWPHFAESEIFGQEFVFAIFRAKPRRAKAPFILWSFRHV
jgi:hypothetical protein